MFIIFNLNLFLEIFEIKVIFLNCKKTVLFKKINLHFIHTYFIAVLGVGQRTCIFFSNLYLFNTVLSGLFCVNKDIIINR